jgi:aminocarboxymuconate-semialdehyde decarboxylase
VSSVGAARVFLGSDYPYDMGTMECVRQVRAAAIAPADRDLILGGRAAAILKKQLQPIAAQ